MIVLVHLLSTGFIRSKSTGSQRALELEKFGISVETLKTEFSHSNEIGDNGKYLLNWKIF